jgi:hypothetical protein
MKKEKGTSSTKRSRRESPVESPRQSKHLRLVVNEVQCRSEGKGKRGTSDKRVLSPEPSASRSASTKKLIGLSYDRVAGKMLDRQVAIYETYTERIVGEIESGLEELHQMVRLVAEIEGHLGRQGEASGSRHAGVRFTEEDEDEDEDESGTEEETISKLSKNKPCRR